MKEGFFKIFFLRLYYLMIVARAQERRCYAVLIEGKRFMAMTTKVCNQTTRIHNLLIIEDFYLKRSKVNDGLSTVG